MEMVYFIIKVFGLIVKEKIGRLIHDRGRWANI